MAVPDAIQLVELAMKAATAYDRPDLDTRLRRTHERLLDPDVRVLVVGEFKQGKSQLVNALVAHPICPVDDDIATAVPTVVQYAEEAYGAVVREEYDENGERRAAHRTEVSYDQIAQYVSESGNPGNSRGLTYAEVGIPRNLLKGGLVLVDTPGVGGLGSAHGAATMAALTAADAVLLVSDAAQEYTRPELDFLAAAMNLCPNVAGVLTKTDLYPEWRRAADADRAHLGRAGVDTDLFPVSSVLRLHALQTEDKDLNEESGYPALIRYLRSKVLAGADDLDRRSVSQDVLGVCEQLSTTMSAELTAQENPEKVAELLANLERAKGAAADLKSRSARWQVTLSDGVADLQSDIDHDLRDRLRMIVREGEQLADDAKDPVEVWDQYAAWLQQQIASAASANFVWATERARYLAQQVAEHFDADGGTVLPDMRMAVDSMGRVSELQKPEGEKPGIGGKALVGMRGGYMGALMFGMLTTLGGMALINPISIGAGVLLGAKALRDDRKRILERHRNEAKVAMRKHVDDVQFQVGKDSRDMLRRMQRRLRDHFTAVAEELHTSLSESVSAAQSALKTTEHERSKRVADLRAELERVENLAGRARTLAPAAAAAAAAR